MSKEDAITKKVELVLEMLQYAYSHSLDISNKEHVKNILKGFKLEYTSEEEIDDFMQLLQDSDLVMDIVAKNKKGKEANLLH